MSILSANARTPAERMQLLLRDQSRRKAMEDCEKDLLAFVRLVWPFVEPSRRLVEGWPLDALADHLMAVTDGHIKRLLINVPPGFTKSLTTNVIWPAWEWGPQKMPFLRYMCISYSGKLTLRDNLRFKQVITNERYREYWGEQFQPDPESFSTTKAANDKKGWKLATSIGGVGTGERADRVVCDDPNSVAEAESEIVRDQTNFYFREVLPTRLNDQAESAIIVIQQRVHENDVSGVILDPDNRMDFEHLCIPMEWDTQRQIKPSTIRWKDPRSRYDGEGRRRPDWETEGELAWEARFSRVEVDRLKTTLNVYASASQLQQMPSARGGNIIRRDWWRLWPHAEFPEYGTAVASLDTALEENEENDYNACTVWGAFGDGDGRPQIMLRDAWKERMPLPKLVKRVFDTCRRHKVDYLLIEKKARGRDVYNAIIELASQPGRSFQTILVEPAGSKVNRAEAVSIMWSGDVRTDPRTGLESYTGGGVWAPDTDWAEMVLDECASFPKGKHDDFVDTATMAMHWMRQQGVAIRAEEHDEAELDRRRYRKPAAPLYDV